MSAAGAGSRRGTGALCQVVSTLEKTAMNAGSYRIPCVALAGLCLRAPGSRISWRPSAESGQLQVFRVGREGEKAGRCQRLELPGGGAGGRFATRCEQPGENDNEYRWLLDPLRCFGWLLSPAPGSKMSWPPSLESGQHQVLREGRGGDEMSTARAVLPHPAKRALSLVRTAMNTASCMIPCAVLAGPSLCLPARMSWVPLAGRGPHVLPRRAEVRESSASGHLSEALRKRGPEDAATSAEQPGARAAPEWVAHGQSTPPAAVPILVAKLQPLQTQAEARFQPRVVTLSVHAPHMWLAVRLHREGEDDRRGQQVGELKTNVIFAVPEGGHFHDAAPGIALALVLLGEDAMGHASILTFTPAVGDDESHIPFLFELRLENRAKGLNRRGIDSSWPHGFRRVLDPDSSKYGSLVPLQQFENRSKELKRRSPSAAAGARCGPADVSSLHLHQHGVEKRAGRDEKAGEKATLQTKEPDGNCRNLAQRQAESEDDQYGLNVRC